MLVQTRIVFRHFVFELDGPGEVTSLTSFFAVSKGTEDIRMVYGGTKSGLHENIWVPRFLLPTIDTQLSFDSRLGEMAITS
jgi:hypothetical protein